MQAVAENDEEQYYNDRQYRRSIVTIDAHIRPRNGGKSSVKILDISETGFRMTTAMWLDEDNDIFLIIPGFESLEANVIWHKNEIYGCTFVKPLHSAIFDHISYIYAARRAK